MRRPIPAGLVESSREAAVMEVNTITDPMRSNVSPSHREPLCSKSEAPVLKSTLVKIFHTKIQKPYQTNLLTQLTDELGLHPE